MHMWSPSVGQIHTAEQEKIHRPKVNSTHIQKKQNRDMRRQANKMPASTSNSPTADHGASKGKKPKATHLNYSNEFQER